MATTEENKKTVENAYKILETGNTSEIKNYFSDDVEDFTQDLEIPERGVENIEKRMKEYRNGFPDVKVKVNDMVAEGDTVTTFLTITGTHTGEFWGIPATNKKINVNFMDKLTVKNGKITQRWGVFDNMKMLTQLGILPELSEIYEKAAKKEAVV